MKATVAGSPPPLRRRSSTTRSACWTSSNAPRRMGAAAATGASSINSITAVPSDCRRTAATPAPDRRVAAMSAGRPTAALLFRIQVVVQGQLEMAKHHLHCRLQLGQVSRIDRLGSARRMRGKRHSTRPTRRSRPVVPLDLDPGSVPRPEPTAWNQPWRDAKAARRPGSTRSATSGKEDHHRLGHGTNQRPARDIETVSS